MEKDEQANPNKTYVLHSNPTASEGLQLKEAKSTQFNAKSDCTGVAFLEDNTIAVYSKGDPNTKEIFAVDGLAKISENTFKVACGVCKVSNARVKTVHLEGEYIITHEVCEKDACHLKFTGKNNILLNVVLARKRSHLGTCHIICSSHYQGDYMKYEFQSNEFGVLIHDTNHKSIEFHSWTSILAQHGTEIAHHPKAATTVGMVKSLFLEENQYGYLVEGNKARVPGMPSFSLLSTKGATYHSLAKMTSTRVLLVASSKSAPTSFLLLADEQGHEVARLEGKVYGHTAMDDYGKESPEEPSFEFVYKINSHLALVRAAYSFFHLVTTNGDKLAFLQQELKVFGLGEAVRNAPIIAWSKDRTAFVCQWIVGPLLTLVRLSFK